MGHGRLGSCHILRSVSFHIVLGSLVKELGERKEAIAIGDISKKVKCVVVKIIAVGILGYGSLETCARLLFMLLQDFFASARSAQKFLLPKSTVHCLCHLKSNNIIGQRTTNKEKHFYP